MLLNINYLNLFIENYAGLGGWGIKDFVRPVPNNMSRLPRYRNDAKKWI